MNGVEMDRKRVRRDTMWRCWLVVIAVTTLNACSSLSKQECLNADWFMIGLEDGSVGRSLDTIGSHRKACAKVDIKPDLVAYERGHDKGRISYCTAINGFNLGNGGGQYNGICRGLGEAAFLQAYDVGKFRYQVRSELDELQRHIQRTEQRLEDIEEDVDLHERQIVSAASTPDSRGEDLAVIKKLEEERGRLIVDLENARASRVIVENELIQLITDQRREGYP